MNFVLSALMLILFDFSHWSRYFSSLLISSAESITLSSDTQVMKPYRAKNVLKTKSRKIRPNFAQRQWLFIVITPSYNSTCIVATDACVLFIQMIIIFG